MTATRDEGTNLSDPVPLARVPLDFDRFYESSYRRALSLAYALTGDRGHAEDIVQEVFAAAHRRWASLATYDEPQAWVRRAVLNKAASRWVRLGRELRAVARFAGRALIPPVQEPPDTEFWAAVAALPQRQAQVVALYYVEDLSVAAIAAVLGCTSGTVKTHLSRARVALHQRLETSHNPEVGND